MATNKAAWLDEKDTPFRVGEAPMPDPGPDEIVIKNHAIAVNAVDWHMQESLIFVKDLPTVLGSDVAGEVHSVGKEVTKFKKGDRVGGLVSSILQAGSVAFHPDSTTGTRSILSLANHKMELMLGIPLLMRPYQRTCHPQSRSQMLPCCL